MERYIFGARANIHIIDLSQSIPLLHQALVKVREVAAGGGRVLFVGTKRQASEPVASAARRCAQYYVNHRWLGGLALGADEQHATAGGRHLAHLDQRLMQQRHRLREIDDVDVGAGAEDVAFHLRVPAVGLVAEVGASFQELTHREIGKRQGLTPSSGAPPQAKTPFPEPGTETRGNVSPARRRTPACVMGGQIGEGAAEIKLATSSRRGRVAFGRQSIAAAQ